MDSYESQSSNFKFKPDYKWPEPGTSKDCPRCGDTLELVENRKTYFGKPWRCITCQWQFSEEDVIVTANALKYFGYGVPAFALVKIVPTNSIATSNIFSMGPNYMFCIENQDYRLSKT